MHSTILMLGAVRLAVGMLHEILSEGHIDALTSQFQH